MTVTEGLRKADEGVNMRVQAAFDCSLAPLGHVHANRFQEGDLGSTTLWKRCGRAGSPSVSVVAPRSEAVHLPEVETPSPSGASPRTRREGLRPPLDMTPEAFLRAAAPPPDELRERLLSFMVHEIRNPLATALWSAEMLARQTTGDVRHDRLAGLAVRSVRRLRVLLEDLFALERLGPPPAAAAGVRLSQAIDRAVAPHDLEPTGIPVHRTPLDDDPFLPLDPLLLDRLLSACLRRALHAGEGGAVRLGVATEEGCVVLHVVRDGASVGQVDPPLLSPGGSEGEGTTFTLLVARVAALRLGVPLDVEATTDGVELRVTLPAVRSSSATGPPAPRGPGVPRRSPGAR
ncbi:MAG: hypothetical protein RL199_1553 [Pseudomonadota bacterium]